MKKPKIGRGRIRTYVEKLQQIYNLSPLTTRPLALEGFHWFPFNLSRFDSNELKSLPEKFNTDGILTGNLTIEAVDIRSKRIFFFASLVKNGEYNLVGQSVRL